MVMHIHDLEMEFYLRLSKQKLLVRCMDKAFPGHADYNNGIDMGLFLAGDILKEIVSEAVQKGKEERGI